MRPAPFTVRPAGKALGPLVLPHAPLVFRSPIGGAAQCLLWLEIGDITTLFQDATGTTPVTGDGDPVRRINDKSGRGNHAIIVGGATVPTYRYNAGFPYLEITTETAFLVANMALTGTGGVTMGAAVRFSGDGMVFNWGQAEGGAQFIGAMDRNSGAARMFGMWGSDAGDAIATNADVTLIGTSPAGGFPEAWVNNASSGPGGSPSTAVPTTAQLGVFSFPGGAFGLAGRFSGGAILNADLGPTERTDFHNYLRALFPSSVSLPIGLALETDTSFAPSIAIGLGISSESNAAQPITALQTRAIGLATEADTAFAPAVKVGIGRAAETDAALGPALKLGTGIPAETNTARALGLAVKLGLATETDTAIGLTQGGLGFTVAIESDQALGPTLKLAIGAATETDAARALGFAMKTGFAAEASTAAALPLSIGFVAASESNQALGRGISVLLGRGGDQATALAPGMAIALTAANENDAALGIPAIFGFTGTTPRSRTGLARGDRRTAAVSVGGRSARLGASGRSAAAGSQSRTAMVSRRPG